jgi:hypothetical protein
VIYGDKGIEETMTRVAKFQAEMVSGKTSKGQISRGAAEGRAVDGVFKHRLRHALDKKLSRWKGVIYPTPESARGADVVSRSLGAAWDVTTVNEVWDHVERDVFGKREKGKARIGDLWDRYYLLVWDEPRTKRKSLVDAIARGRL